MGIDDLVGESFRVTKAGHGVRLCMVWCVTKLLERGDSLAKVILGFLKNRTNLRVRHLLGEEALHGFEVLLHISHGKPLSAEPS